MRSNLLPIDQLLMCMNKIQQGDHYPTPTPSIAKTEQYPIYSSENSRTSFDGDDTISFGPIKVKPRKKPAPTLATGRRSKYEILNADEEHKRNIRRARNRAAAERVRVSRLNIEQQLLDEISALEKQEEKLLQNVETLQHQKLHLETRLFTHEKMCSNIVAQNSIIKLENDRTNYFPLENSSISSQQYDTTIIDKMTDFDFDDAFINLFTTEHIQENFPESLSSIMTSDDLNDFFMNS
ncbi:unnamed protein product [Rotaria socialis]|uniref:BZIP domain-containing protein n=1 Tax=Rotaria socialis TaxID=392032 RepID=A0A817ZXV5_9BILA|nr:unnamed protein product [Rotaria socialis]CAF3629593.1 unnamed protein product [Rotaria socialis]CAF4475787.1 unnamed protein product [Rotaria socialis]CAF4575850.1 unnamed protein product [Rotaria socialis]